MQTVFDNFLWYNFDNYINNNKLANKYVNNIINIVIDVKSGSVSDLKPELRTELKSTFKRGIRNISAKQKTRIENISINCYNKSSLGSYDKFICAVFEHLCTYCVNSIAVLYKYLPLDQEENRIILGKILLTTRGVSYTNIYMGEFVEVLCAFVSLGIHKNLHKFTIWKNINNIFREYVFNHYSLKFCTCVFKYLNFLLKSRPGIPIPEVVDLIIWINEIVNKLEKYNTVKFNLIVKYNIKLYIKLMKINNGKPYSGLYEITDKHQLILSGVYMHIITIFNNMFNIMHFDSHNDIYYDYKQYADLFAEINSLRRHTDIHLKNNAYMIIRILDHSLLIPGGKIYDLHEDSFNQLKDFNA